MNPTVNCSPEYRQLYEQQKQFLVRSKVCIKCLSGYHDKTEHNKIYFRTYQRLVRAKQDRQYTRGFYKTIDNNAETRLLSLEIAINRFNQMENTTLPQQV